MTVPLPTTPNDIITLALKMANVTGVGQTPTAEDLNDCFNLLNMMLAQWQRKRFMVYGLTTTSLVANGSQSYTVGIGGNFNIPRPAKIESAYSRLNAGTSQPVDNHLSILRSQDDYNRLSLKQLNAYPEYLFYDQALPLGNIFFWPVPNAQYTMFISTLTQLQQFVTTADVITLPPEYEAAIMWSLVEEIYPLYGLQPNPTVEKKAAASRAILEDANVQIPQLNLPPALKSNRGTTYNIYGDQLIGSTP